MITAVCPMEMPLSALVVEDDNRQRDYRMVADTMFQVARFKSRPQYAMEAHDWESAIHKRHSSRWLVRPADVVKSVVLTQNLPWKIKNEDLLDGKGLTIIRKLSFSLLGKYAAFDFANVSDTQTFTVGLDLGKNYYVRITSYYGDFRSFFLSFFQGDEIVRQEHLDLNNTVKAVSLVHEKLKSLDA